MNPTRNISFPYISSAGENLENERPQKKQRIVSINGITSINDLTDVLLNRILLIVSRSTSSVEDRKSGMESALCISKQWSIQAAKVKKDWFENNNISFLSYNCKNARDVLKCVVDKDLNVLNLWDQENYNIIKTAKDITDDELNQVLEVRPELKKLSITSEVLTTLNLSKSTKIIDLSIVHCPKLANIILNTNLTSLEKLLLNGINKSLVVKLLEASPNLTSLHVIDNKCEDNSLIKVIASKTKLISLRLNAFHTPTFAPLAKLTNISELYFCGSNITESQLKIMFVSMNQITHLQVSSTDTVNEERLFAVINRHPQFESFDFDSGRYSRHLDSGSNSRSWQKDASSESDLSESDSSELAS